MNESVCLSTSDRSKKLEWRVPWMPNKTILRHTLTYSTVHTQTNQFLSCLFLFVIFTTSTSLSVSFALACKPRNREIGSTSTPCVILTLTHCVPDVPFSLASTTSCPLLHQDHGKSESTRAQRLPFSPSQHLYSLIIDLEPVCPASRYPRRSLSSSLVIPS